MELTVSGCVLALVSLATATPYGYGAKSGAAAKAEASAGSFGAFPVVPLPAPGTPGFSGSFSKSSSSSFASSSASSSSFSYSGAGALIPGYGSAGCGGDCQNGGKADGASLNGQNEHGQGHNVAGATANSAAGAVAVPGYYNGNGPCDGSNCPIPVQKCTTGQCGGNAANGNAAASGNTQSQSGANDDDFAVNIQNKPHSSGFDENNQQYKNDQVQSDLNKGKNPGLPFGPSDNTQPSRIQGSECQSPDCRKSLPHGPGNNNGNIATNPTSPGESSYQEEACATHDCKSPNPNPNKKPTSYNVPILGSPQPTTNQGSPICTSGSCGSNDVQNNDDTQYVVKPSITLEVPTGPSEGPQCTSKECLNPSSNNNEKIFIQPGSISATPGKNPSYHSYNNDVNQSGKPTYSSGNPSGSGPDYNPSYQPNGPSPKPYNPNGPSNFDFNPSIHPSGPAGSANVPSQYPTATIDLNTNKPSYQPGDSGKYPTPQSNVPYGTDVNLKRPSASNPINEIQRPDSPPKFTPTGQATNVNNLPAGSTKNPGCLSGNCGAPSYHSAGHPVGPGGDLSGPHSGYNKPTCTSGICGNPYPTGGSINPSNKPYNGYSNVKPQYDTSVPTSNTQPGAPLGCVSPNCYPGSEVPSPGSSILEVPGHSKTESEVLLSNKGNKIYSGGFGGPVGILSVNNAPNKAQPSKDGIFVNPHPNQNHNTQYSSQPSVPQLPPQPPAHHPKVPQQPNAVNGHNDEDKPHYTGGFGGPAGLLKPNEFKVPTNVPKAPCVSGSCNPNPGTPIGGSGAHAAANAAAVANANAASFSGTFGGPPGLLKPYDAAKPDKSGAIGKQSNGYGPNVGIPNNVQPINANGLGAGSQASAVASASAIAGSYGHPGGCNSGCPSFGAGHDINHSTALGHSSSGVPSGANLANASASAKSVAGSYAQGRSVATASAQASAGAAAKGGYAWR